MINPQKFPGPRAFRILAGAITSVMLALAASHLLAQLPTPSIPAGPRPTATVTPLQSTPVPTATVTPLPSASPSGTQPQTTNTVAPSPSPSPSL